MTKKLSRQKSSKLSDIASKAHYKQLSCLNQHLQDIGSTAHRAKNEFDPLNNPVRLFRRTQGELEKVSLNSF
jgi:hypothetical protein